LTIEIVFETHSTTEDNEAGVATGWLPGRLAPVGRDNARLMGERRGQDGLAAIFVSDLARAVETVEVAFPGTPLPILHDWRLRECDYGELNGAPTQRVHGDRSRYLTEPYPGGESWTQAVERVSHFLTDLPLRWQGRRVLVVGHVATRWGLDHFLRGTSLAELASEDFRWQEGWEYRLDG
jgi:broad specificity phosphatase PhoE